MHGSISSQSELEVDELYITIIKSHKKQKENRVAAGTEKITIESPKETRPIGLAHAREQLAEDSAQARSTHTR